jgi:effector-binding domain-containing protein
VTDVSVVRIAPSFIGAVRRRTTFAALPGQIREFFDVVYTVVRSGQITQGGHNVIVYRNPSDAGVDVECGVQVAGPFADVGEVQCRDLPGGEVATAVHWGPYSRLGETHDAVVEWVRASGRTLAGVGWEVYGDPTEDPAQTRTDVCHLLMPRGSG